MKYYNLPRSFLTRWWFQIFFIFIPIPGEMIQFDYILYNIFQMGWKNSLTYFSIIFDLEKHKLGLHVRPRFVVVFVFFFLNFGFGRC